MCAPDQEVLTECTTTANTVCQPRLVGFRAVRDVDTTTGTDWTSVVGWDTHRNVNLDSVFALGEAAPPLLPLP